MVLPFGRPHGSREQGAPGDGAPGSRRNLSGDLLAQDVAQVQRSERSQVRMIPGPFSYLAP
ncbi:MAG TPA: hypothetical protein VMU89_23125, partial [Thermomicrobiaceae bacterium]|nr:hypothetical protein [Thermomicrobiaceae bacterium]